MSYRLSRLLPPFDDVAGAPELEADLRGGAEDDRDDDGGVAADELRKGDSYLHNICMLGPKFEVSVQMET